MFSFITVSLLLLSTCYVDAYSVKGKVLYGPNGKPVRVRGVDRPSLEWNPAGEALSLADYQNMASWGFNVGRISMSQAFWLSGSGRYVASYKATIAQQVAWIKECGMGVILDLHWSQGDDINHEGSQRAMADIHSITFWTEVATIYKNDPDIMFELYNEPYVNSWDIWRNGGRSDGFTIAGMQQLYDTVRATGANNVVIIGGLDYAYDLSGVATHAITGSNIAYSTHPYNLPGKLADKWDSGFGFLAESYPIIMTEFGQFCDANSGYVARLLQYAESRGIHWTAWAWYPGGCQWPGIIDDWAGTPNSVGLIVKNLLATSVPEPEESSSSDAATPTPTAAPTKIYSDSLASGWSDYSWGTTSFTATSPVRSGSKSISMKLASFPAVYFRSSTAISIGGYESLQFYTYGPTASVQVKLYGSSLDPIASRALPLSSTGGSWVLQTVPLSSFKLSSTSTFFGFTIFYNAESNAGTLYIDDVSLNGAPAPTSIPTSIPPPSDSEEPGQDPETTPTSKPTIKPTSKSTVKPSSTVKPATNSTSSNQTSIDRLQSGSTTLLQQQHLLYVALTIVIAFAML